MKRHLQIEPDGFFEAEAYKRGFRLVAGIDEAGRGPLAGPVVAAAVLLPRQTRLPGLLDSKCLLPEDRELLYRRIEASAIGIGVGFADEREIDAIGILPATRNAMRRAVRQLNPSPDYLLIDAVSLPGAGIAQRAVIKGDSLSRSVAAASIIAKVARDRWMAEIHTRYPQYNFLTHKGYGTREHLRRLEQFGPCEVHRRCFRPISDHPPR